MIAFLCSYGHSFVWCICRRLYYTVCTDQPFIEMCDLAGNNCRKRESERELAMRCISDLVVDQKNRGLYWTDRKLGVIFSSNLFLKNARPIR